MMEVTLSALLTLVGIMAGWLFKGFTAARNSGKTESDALHHAKDFETFKSETGVSFSELHQRIDRHKERQEGYEIRQNEKFYEILKGQGHIEGQLNTLVKIFDKRGGANA